MTATLAPPAPEHDDLLEGLTGSSITLRRRTKDRAATAFMVLALLIAAGPLVHLIYTVASKGAHAITIDWFTKDIPGNIGQTASQQQINDRFAGGSASLDVTKVVLGMRPAIVGTLLTTLVASLLAIPLGILGAVYLNEYGKKGRLASFIRFMSDVMTGVPSVVMGLFIFTVWVVPNGVSGASAFAGALALGCLMLPIVVRSSEEMLRLVPDNLREASAALGTRTWRTTLGVVLPAALPGITSGCMLAVARAAGETAPLLFTIGGITATNFSLQGGNTSLSMQIFANATENTNEQTLLAWGAALTLITTVLILTMLARFVTGRFANLR
jgi:phosphate transport system permease protein